MTLDNISSTQSSQLDICTFKGKNFTLNERIEDGCEKICFCRKLGEIECSPRCKNQIDVTKSDRCVIVKDKDDSCCEKQLCDVSLDDHEQSGFVPLIDENSTMKQGIECLFKGKNYKLNDQFHDECEQFCFCDKDGVICSKIECPSTFALDVIDPSCISWLPEPATFRAIAPKCCPEKMKCINNGTCEFKGNMYDNWSEIPSSVSGCETHCFCEDGKVECRPNCPPVPALPPSSLPCNHQFAKLVPLDDEDEDACCKTWACSEDSGIFYGSFITTLKRWLFLNVANISIVPIHHSLLSYALFIFHQ